METSNVWPKVLHRIWTGIVPEKDSFADYNKNWTITNWTMETLEQWMNSFERTWLQDMWFEYKSSEDKINLGAFMLMATYGGIYAREDVIFGKPVEGLLHDCTGFLTLDNPEHGKMLMMNRSLISSAVFGSVPNHPFWYNLFYVMKGCKNSLNISSRSGGIMLTETVKISFESGQSDMAIYEHGFFSPYFRGQNIPKSFPGIGCCTWTFNPDVDRDVLPEEPKTEEPIKENAPEVFLAILVRNKAHVLPRYLRCIEGLDYPKEKIHLFVHTNNNDDGSDVLISKWLERHGRNYWDFEMVDTDYSTLNPDTTKPHDWANNVERLSVLSRIRQGSLNRASELGAHYYFVVDCDNFLLPQSLTKLIEAQKPIVAPMLHCVGDPLLSNFMRDLAKDASGSYIIPEKMSIYTHDPIHKKLVEMQERGLHQVPIVHCTYLIDLKYARSGELDYSTEKEFEFITFSRSARGCNMNQYVDNRFYYGVFLHFWGSRENEKALMITREPILCLLETEMLDQNVALNTESREGTFSGVQKLLNSIRAR